MTICADERVANRIDRSEHDRQTFMSENGERNGPAELA